MSASRVLSPMTMPLYVSSCGRTNSVPRACSSPSACVVTRPSTRQSSHHRHGSAPLSCLFVAAIGAAVKRDGSKAMCAPGVKHLLASTGR